MRARLRDVACDRAAELLGVPLPHLSQAETCISGNGQKQRHESQQEQPAQQEQDLEAETGAHPRYRIRPFRTVLISGESPGKSAEK